MPGLCFRVCGFNDRRKRYIIHILYIILLHTRAHASAHPRAPHTTHGYYVLQDAGLVLRSTRQGLLYRQHSVVHKARWTGVVCQTCKSSLYALQSKTFSIYIIIIMVIILYKWCRVFACTYMYILTVFNFFNPYGIQYNDNVKKVGKCRVPLYCTYSRKVSSVSP